MLRTIERASVEGPVGRGSIRGTDASAGEIALVCGPVSAKRSSGRRRSLDPRSTAKQIRQPARTIRVDPAYSSAPQLATPGRPFSSAQSNGRTLQIVRGSLVDGINRAMKSSRSSRAMQLIVRRCRPFERRRSAALGQRSAFQRPRSCHQRMRPICDRASFIAAARRIFWRRCRTPARKRCSRT